MVHRTQRKLRRSPAGRSSGEEKRREYRFTPAEDLHTFCLETVGLSRGEVWSVGVDYFRFTLRNGNTVLAGPALDRFRDRYAFTLPVEPEELAAVEARLGYLRDGECRRTFRTVTLPLEALERRDEGGCTMFRPVWRAYLTGSVPVPGLLAGAGEETPCETHYSAGF